jgi:hypothetical protein
VTNIHEVRGMEAVNGSWDLYYYITFNATCFGFNTRSHYWASTSLTTLLRGGLQNNTTTRGLKALVYIYLMQYYEEQIINKNKGKNGLISRRTCN